MKQAPLMHVHELGGPLFESVQEYLSAYASAFWNMKSIFVTAEVSHALISLSNTIASANICSIFKTFEVLQSQRSWLKAEAFPNINFMFDTRDVSQLPMGLLNIDVP